MEKKTCTKCKKTKSIDEFRFHHKKEGKRHAQCKTCIAAVQAAHYQANKDVYKKRGVEFTRKQRDINRRKLVEYLRAHPCVDCGETDIVVLQFDHQKDKKKNVGTMLKSAYCWETILKEIEKCEVKCANCHARKTARENGWFKFTAR